MVFKRLFISYTGESPRGQSWLSQYNRFTKKMVLNRQFFGDAGKGSVLHICCSGLPGDRALRAGVLALQGLILDNFHIEGVWWVLKGLIFDNFYIEQVW